MRTRTVFPSGDSVGLRNLASVLSRPTKSSLLCRFASASFSRRGGPFAAPGATGPVEVIDVRCRHTVGVDRCGAGASAGRRLSSIQGGALAGKRPRISKPIRTLRAESCAALLHGGGFAGVYSLNDMASMTRPIRAGTHTAARRRRACVRANDESQCRPGWLSGPSQSPWKSGATFSVRRMSCSSAQEIESIAFRITGSRCASTSSPFSTPKA